MAIERRFWSMNLELLMKIVATEYFTKISVPRWVEVYPLRVQNLVRLIVIMTHGAKTAQKDFQGPGGTVPVIIVI